jgi:uncharacterized membrane protein
MSRETASFEGVIVAAYADEETAETIMKDVEQAKKDGSFRYWDAAVVKIDEKGRYFSHESKDMSTPKGAGIGAVVGGIIGIAGGPAGVILGSGLGAALGGLFANRDGGISDLRLEEVGHALGSGHSAIIIVADHDYLAQMQEYAGEDEIAVAMHKLTDGIHAHMEHDSKIAYTITSAGRSVSCHLLRDNEILGLLQVEVPSEHN